MAAKVGSAQPSRLTSPSKSGQAIRPLLFAQGPFDHFPEAGLRRLHEPGRPSRPNEHASFVALENGAREHGVLLGRPRTPWHTTEIGALGLHISHLPAIDRDFLDLGVDLIPRFLELTEPPIDVRFRS